MRRTTASLVLLFIAIAGCSVAPGAQTVIEGTVVMDGAPLPGVTVTLTDASKRERKTVTDVAGKYRFIAAPGVYTIVAELEGLQTVRQRVMASNNAKTTVLTRMKVSSVAEAITVTAAAPMVVTPRYVPIREHDFIAARKQPVTTFAIDVDRASYANVRLFLSQNEMPPEDAVRIEEMVNYFTYSLPQPTGREPFSITTEVAGCPWNPANRLLRIAIQGKNLEEWRMAPNNLVFLLDVSGSMQPPERLPLIKSALRVLVDQLRAEDSVAIVTYAGAEGLALPPTSGADKQTILTALDNLESEGSTAGAAGIELAYKVAREHFIADGNNRVILATDGDFNVGISSLPALEKLIEKKRESGIYLTTIGVGNDNYHDSVLELLADKGNGNYAYLDSLKEAEKVFKSELTGTLVAIAKDVKVQLEFDPAAVASYRQIGYENRALENKDFTDDAKDAGELGAGHTVTALYEIVPAPGASAGRIGTVRLRYKLPKSNTSAPIEAAVHDDGKSAYDASPDMQFASAVAEFGMLLRKSPHRGNASFAEVLQLARISRGEDLDGLREEFIRLADSARLLSGEGITIIGAAGAR